MCLLPLGCWVWDLVYLFSLQHTSWWGFNNWITWILPLFLSQWWFLAFTRWIPSPSSVHLENRWSLAEFLHASSYSLLTWTKISTYPLLVVQLCTWLFLNQFGLRRYTYLLLWTPLCTPDTYFTCSRPSFFIPLHCTMGTFLQRVRRKLAGHREHIMSDSSHSHVWLVSNLCLLFAICLNFRVQHISRLGCVSFTCSWVVSGVCFAILSHAYNEVGCALHVPTWILITCFETLREDREGR